MSNASDCHASIIQITGLSYSLWAECSQSSSECCGLSDLTFFLSVKLHNDSYLVEDCYDCIQNLFRNVIVPSHAYAILPAFTAWQVDSLCISLGLLLAGTRSSQNVIHLLLMNKIGWKLLELMNPTLTCMFFWGWTYHFNMWMQHTKLAIL